MTVSEEIELKGHIIDSIILPRVLDAIMDMEGDFEILSLDVGKKKTDISTARMVIRGKDHEHLDKLLDELQMLGAVLPVKNVETEVAPRDKILPDKFYSTTHHPTYVRIKDRWMRAKDIEMDCTIVIEDERAICKRQGLVKKGDRVVVGHSGVRVEPPERSRKPMDIFGFMQSDVSPEKPINSYIVDLAKEMNQIRENNGKIIVVAGPAIVHTGADKSLAELVRMGYVQVLFGGNALAVMDIEKQLFGTSLGMDEHTGLVLERGYKSHLVAINEIWKVGSIKDAVKRGIIKEGIMYECVKCEVPYVLAGSIRDDGPLPEVITDVMEAQDEMRKYIQDADMVIMTASMLHSIATGNLLPSWVKTVSIDINPYVVTRLQDRGTSQALGIVSDPGMFLPRLVEELKKLE